MRNSSSELIFIFVLALTMLSGYADESKQTPEDSEQSKIEESAEPEMEEKTIAEILQGLTVIDNVMSRRDPFEKHTPEIFKNAGKVEEKPSENNVGEDTPELLRFSASNYTVLAVLLGDVYPRAIVKTPKGNTFIVKEAEKIGNRDGVIGKIDDAGVIVEEKIKNQYDKFSKIEIKLPLSGGAGK